MSIPPASNLIALIPARSGSKRVHHKNIRSLNGHPLMAYTVQAALQSNIFDRVLVSTDSDEYAQIARHYGAQVPFLRPASLSQDTSMDVEWVRYTLDRLSREGSTYSFFSILRPTSPFRTAGTIRRAWKLFQGEEEADALRAVEPCKQHPGKMWTLQEGYLQPLLSSGNVKKPWHSMPYASLPEVYVQNASLEIARTAVLYEQGNITGTHILAFRTQGIEGLDINDEADWREAESIGAEDNTLPKIGGLHV